LDYVGFFRLAKTGFEMKTDLQLKLPLVAKLREIKT